MKSNRDVGARHEIRYGVGKSSLGMVLVAQSDRGICAILMGDHAEALAGDLQKHFPDARLMRADAGLSTIVEKVIAMVETPPRAAELLLDVRGTAFQQRVWRALREIPAGKTASYTEVAKHIGSPHSVRAVASACAANTLAMAIPCHRVVRGDGRLSGYRWGVERKRALLEREAITA